VFKIKDSQPGSQGFMPPFFMHHSFGLKTGIKDSWAIIGMCCNPANGRMDFEDG
jgi:hypothetical protein